MKRYWRVGVEWRLPEPRFPEHFHILQENGDELLKEDSDNLDTEEAS